MVIIYATVGLVLFLCVITEAVADATLICNCVVIVSSPLPSYILLLVLLLIIIFIVVVVVVVVV